MHVIVVDEGRMRDRHCRTDWLCDIRSTPVFIVRRGCLSPDDAEMFAAEIGRAMTGRKVHGPGSATGLKPLQKTECARVAAGRGPDRLVPVRALHPADPVQSPL